MVNDIFKSPCNTIKLLLRTNAIPFLIIDYERNMLQVLMYRAGMFLLCEADYQDYDISLKIAPLLESKIDLYILQSTRITLDRNILSDEMFYDLLEAISNAQEIIRSRMISINNNQGTGFTESDFITLGRLAVKAKQDLDFWSLD